MIGACAINPQVAARGEDIVCYLRTDAGVFAGHEHHIGVLQILNRYAEMVDSRQWSLADKIFTEDAIGRYSDGEVSGRDELIASIRARLGGCGPTQHLLGNYMIEVTRDQAVTSCSARIFHMGAGAREKLGPYESFGDYRDILVRTPSGWRIKERRLTIRMRRGDRSVLQPG